MFKLLFPTAIHGLLLCKLISRKPLSFLASTAPSSKGSCNLSPAFSKDLQFPQATSIAECLRETGRRLCSAVTNADSSPQWWHQPFPHAANNLRRIAGTLVNSKMRQLEIRTSYGDESAAQCVRDALETAYELQTLTDYKYCATFLCIVLMRAMKKINIIPTFLQKTAEVPLISCSDSAH